MAHSVSSFIARYEPGVGALARATRSFLRRTMPTANQLVYDSYNALAVGFGPNERTSDCIAGLAVYPRGVSLFLYEGATLPDPGGLLEGGGNRYRFIRVTSRATLLDPRVRALVRAAIAQSDVPLPKIGRGRVIIKAVSARQRPRRPATRR